MKSTRDPIQVRLRAMADPSRFRILTLLREGARCVGAVADEVGLSQSCTTRHLQLLERSGLVRREPHGRQVEVSLAEPARRLLESLTAPGPAAAGAARRAGAGPGRAARPVAPPAAPQRPAAAESREGPREKPPRADTPESDTPSAPSPAAPDPPARRPARSTLEDYLL